MSDADLTTDSTDSTDGLDPVAPVDGTGAADLDHPTDSADPEADLEADEEFELVQESEPELPLPVWEPTGDAAVDAALDELMRLDQMGTGDHVEVYTAVHAALHRRLSELEA